MKSLNWLVSALAAPLGFFIALIVALIVELLSVGSWFIATLFTVLFIGLFVFDKLVDVIWDPIMDRIFRFPKEDPEAAKAEKRNSRIAFVIGFLLGLLASWIWSVEQILELF